MRNISFGQNVMNLSSVHFFRTWCPVRPTCVLICVSKAVVDPGCSGIVRLGRSLARKGFANCSTYQRTSGFQLLGNWYTSSHTGIHEKYYSQLHTVCRLNLAPVDPVEFVPATVAKNQVQLLVRITLLLGWIYPKVECDMLLDKYNII